MNSMRSTLLSGKKKKWSIEPSIGCICKCSGNLCVPGDQGKSTFIEALIKRGDCNGVKVEELKDQVMNFESKIFNDEASSKIQWHKGCYSAFVSKRNLQFVSKETPSCQSDNKGDSLLSISTRSKIKYLPNFENVCLFCEKTKHKKYNKLIKVESDEFCEKMEICNEKADHGLRVKIGGDFSKLLLLKAHYHKNVMLRMSNLLNLKLMIRTVYMKRHSKTLQRISRKL